MATTFVSAEQVINLWKNTHGIELSKYQMEKLMTAVTLIVDGAYALGKRDALNTLDSIKERELEPDGSS